MSQLFDIVLKCNVFNFDRQIYKQIQSTVMGARMTPSYGNLFMDRFERAQEPLQPLVWKCYKDNIICIKTGTRNKPESFLARHNTQWERLWQI